MDQFFRFLLKWIGCDDSQNTFKCEEDFIELRESWDEANVQSWTSGGIVPRNTFTNSNFSNNFPNTPFANQLQQLLQEYDSDIINSEFIT